MNLDSQGAAVVDKYNNPVRTFAMSIPTGYGSIAPISGEIKDPEKTVGRAVYGEMILQYTKYRKPART